MRRATLALVGLLAGCEYRRTTDAGPLHALPASAAVVLEKGKKVSIRVPPEVMADDQPMNIEVESSHRPEEDRRLVREGVKDLARVLSAVSGATVTIATIDAGEGYPIRVGSFVHQDVGAHAIYGQGYRAIVGKDGASLFGESGLATSYAIYELLDRLGCRWYFPGPYGEVLPKAGPIVLPILDVARAPSTLYRGVWYADDAWKRRNRQGGLLLDAGHALELRYVNKDDRAKHPEWRATVGGKAHEERLKWSNEALAKHVADRIVLLHAKDGAPTYSIAPDDGGDFDESPADRALDGGDFDPTTNRTSVTDRFMVLANRIATRVVLREPDLLLGFLAYSSYTRPPVREPVHPALVPQIAPITYSRAHPMDDDRVPGNKDLRAAIEGWAAKSRALSMYCYGWFLAEPVAPNPMITKWGHDVPWLLAHNVKLWQPETLPTFESNMHALTMSMRVAFDSKEKPADVFAALERDLYGEAAAAMHGYWAYVDELWVGTPEYAGGEHGHARRFTKERVGKMRALMDAAKGAAKTEIVKKRIELADDALSLFEDFMQMRWAFVEGRLDGLDAMGTAYMKRATGLGDKWEAASAFAKTYYAPEGIYAKYYESFQKISYDDAARLAKSHVVDHVLRDWSYATPKKSGTTHVGVDTWSALGLHDYFGTMTYETKAALPRVAGKRVLLWIGAVDGAFEVKVDGKPARFVPRPGGPKTPDSFAVPLAFDLTGLATATESTITIKATRKALDELGIGGITGPVIVAHER
ncbi:MAG: DUF4838 domain-containing protein [Rubrivivax sp.]